MNRLFRVTGACAVLLLVVLAVAACGGGGSSSSSSEESTSAATETETSTSEGSGEGGEIEINVGPQTLKYPAGTKPKIAMFAGSGVVYQEVARKAAEEQAKEYGYELTYYDSKFEATTQLQQLQNALSGGEYNAWVLEADAGKLACSTVKQAAEKNIAIVQIVNFTCEQANKPANEESWTPGTIASVGAATTLTYYESFAKQVKEMIKTPNPVVGVVNGPPTIPTTEELQTALEKAGIEVEDEVATAYLIPEGLKETQTMLQAHPDINVIISVADDPTVGAVRAIEAAGKTGEIEVFDLGGSKAAVKLIEEGKLVMTAPYFPATTAAEGVTVLHKAFEGEPTERFYDGFAVGTVEKPFFVTKANVHEYEPEY